MGTKQPKSKTPSQTTTRRRSENWEELFKKAQQIKKPGPPRAKRATRRASTTAKAIRVMPKVKGAKAGRLQEKVVAKTYLALPNAKQQLSNEERLLVISHRAVYLHGVECKPYREIATQIQTEFQLVHTPSVTTVCRWMNIGRAEFLEDIKDIRDQLRLDQFNEIENIKRRWIEAALRNLNVRKTRMVNGETIEEVDEDDHKAHAKAAEIFIKCCERQAKLIGLDLAASEVSGPKRWV